MEKPRATSSASWPDCVPPADDSFFSVYCDKNYLHWGFHRPNGHFLKWRTPHISNVGDDIVKELSLYFPDDSDALRYVFGKSPTFQNVMKRSKERTCTEVYVFYIDNAAVEDDKNQELYAKQLHFLNSIWAAVPCKEFKINPQHFIESSQLLSTHKDRVKKDFGSVVISAFVTASTHFHHPLLTIHETTDGTLHYIGSWTIDSKPFLMSGILDNSVDKDRLLNELNKVVYRWKQNVIDTQPNIECLTIVMADDHEYHLESKLIQMLDEKESSGFKDSGFKVARMSNSILHSLNHLMDSYRDKVAEAAIEAKKEEEAKKAALKAKMAKEESERLQRLIEEEAKKLANSVKDNDKDGIENEKSARKRRQDEANNDTKTSKKRVNNNDVDGIEKNSGKKAKDGKKKDYMGAKVAKEFEDGIIYFGVVKEFIDDDEPFWNIQYEDGDGEDMEEEELIQSIMFYNNVSKQDKKGASTFKVYTPNKKSK